MCSLFMLLKVKNVIKNYEFYGDALAQWSVGVKGAGGWKAGAGCIRYMSCSSAATETSPTVSRNSSNSMDRALTARKEGSRRRRRPNLE